MRRAALLLAAFVLAPGCQTLIPATPLSPDDPRPAALLRALSQRSDALQSMRGRARIAIDADDLRLRAAQRIAVRRPALLRVEVLGFFGQVETVLVTDGRAYRFFDAASRELDSGLVTPGFLWEMVRVDLTPEQAVALFLGAPAPAPGLVLGAAHRLGDGSIRLRLDDRHGVARQRFVIGPRGQLRRVANWDADGERGWEARFEDYRDVGGTLFPFDTELRFPRLDARARFRFSGVELGLELPEEVFELTRLQPVPGVPRGGAR